MFALPPLPPPLLVEHEGIIVVRDDLLPGGTKRRALPAFLDDQHDEYVYASPVYGHAQIALAYLAQDVGVKASIFCAKRKEWHELTKEAADLGALIHEVPNGYLRVVQARAREHCEQHRGAKLLPFGLNDPAFIEALAVVALELPVWPTEVWTAVGSGVLTRALQIAWPKAKFCGVRVGASSNAGLAYVYAAPEVYEQSARILPPFPSCSNYDAKVWRFIKEYAAPGALFWNVA